MDYRFKIITFENYDGDSFDLTLDLGFDLVTHRKCRIDGVDTPELRGGTDDSKAAAKVARDMAHLFVGEGLVKEEDVVFVSENYTGKYGRPLGDIEVNGQSLREYLIERNYGVPYHGQAKASVQSLHDANLAVLKERGEI